MKDPSDLFEVDGRPAENIYILGEAGRGKTGQCYQLIQHWVEARKAQRKSKKLSKWQKAMIVFDFLFFVSLRHVHKRMHSVVKIICRSVLKTFPQYHETIRQILTSDLRTCKCLIVIDGLDEKKGDVEIDVNMSRCTVLRTSRHWKFHDLAPDIKDLDRVVEVCGLDYYGKKQVIEKILVNYFGIADESKELHGKVEETFKKIMGEKYKSLMDIPLLLTASVYLWQSNTSLQESMTSFYAALLNLLIKLAYDNKRVTKNPVIMQSMTKIDFPSFMTKQRKLRDHLETLVLIGKVAYEDLVLKNEKFEYDKTEEYEGKRKEALQLVFEKDELIEKLGDDVLIFALEVGLLSQSSAPGSFDDENVSINFYHKTIEEFLAALYIVCSDEVSFDSFRRSCTCINIAMELSNILLFSVGLQPTLGSVISDKIAKIPGTDPDIDQGIIRYRQGFGNENEHQKVKRMFKTLCNIKKEMNYSLMLSKTTQISKFIISDVYLDVFPDDSTVAISTEILSQDNDSIVSLHFEFGRNGIEPIPFQVVKEFLDNTSFLQTLHIWKGISMYDFVFKQSIKNKPTLCSIAPIFSSLTSLSLVDIILTNDAAGLLQNAIQTNINIQSFELYRLWRTDNVTEVRLDMKANSRLRALFLDQGSVVESLNIQLVDITQCKSLNMLSLDHVHVQSVDMLQAALSSFTQLKDLTLDSVTFSSDNKDNIYLDLVACKDLTELNLATIHVNSIKICPDSLQNFTLFDVSGSLRGLLSTLPECQHLTDIRIISLSDEQDVKLLSKVLPRLTQVRDMEYHVDTQRDARNEGVVWYHSAVAQAAALMTGLERLKIYRIDMGDLALTPTSLMRNIKRMGFSQIQMTANSWAEFIASLLTIQHGFDIDLWNTNIEDKSVSTLHSSPHFNVKWDRKGNKERKYSCLEFSKLSS